MTKFTSTLIQLFLFIVLVYAFMTLFEHGVDGFEKAVLADWATYVAYFRG